MPVSTIALNIFLSHSSRRMLAETGNGSIHSGPSNTALEQHALNTTKSATIRRCILEINTEKEGHGSHTARREGCYYAGHDDTITLCQYLGANKAVKKKHQKELIKRQQADNHQPPASIQQQAMLVLWNHAVHGWHQHQLSKRCTQPTLLYVWTGSKSLTASHPNGGHAMDQEGGHSAVWNTCPIHANSIHGHCLLSQGTC